MAKRAKAIEQRLCLYLGGRVELAREIEHLRKLLGLPNIIADENYWETLYGPGCESDIRHRLLEHRFCNDGVDDDAMFVLLRKEEVEAAREIERLNTLLASRST